MPNWIGVSLSVICIALSFCAWNFSNHSEQMNAKRNKKNVTEINKIVRFVANYRFNQIINQFEDLAENSAQLTESNCVTVSNDEKKIPNATEAIIAIGWSQGPNDIY
jgi:hypothetical protein